MLESITEFFRRKWFYFQLAVVYYECMWFHKKYQIVLPLYRQGTYVKIGDAVFCKKCMKN